MTREFLAKALVYLRQVRQFSGLLLHRFVKDEGVEHAAALTYTTLLSLVPLMTVMLALFSAFPASELLAQQVENFVFENFVPTAGEAVQEHLRNFSSKAARLTGVGFIVLVIVALLLMGNIDKAFNAIWHVRRKRSPVAKFMVYWAILSLGPVLIVVSVGVTSYLVSIPLFIEDETVVQLRTRLLGTMPVLISGMAFTLLYALVPNRTVLLRHALAGGILAALLFEVAKRGFAWYVTHFPTYEAIYGAMAVVPIFLIWLYLSWLVTLLGAEFTYCLSIYRDDWRASMTRRGSDFLTAIKLLRHLREVQRNGRSLSIQDLAKREPGLTEEHLDGLLGALQQARLVLQTDDKGWALARDLREVKLIELYLAAPFVLPDLAELQGESSRLSEVLTELDGEVQRGMERSLGELLETG
ncbi:MAG: virulence factor BrkB family protein [Gammaproteobacteria bacterium]|nr:virulence factor BrkB family protein [Gammaproteobacteria bacterium]